MLQRRSLLRDRPLYPEAVEQALVRLRAVAVEQVQSAQLRALLEQNGEQLRR